MNQNRAVGSLFDALGKGNPEKQSICDEKTLWAGQFPAVGVRLRDSVHQRNALVVLARDANTAYSYLLDERHLAFAEEGPEVKGRTIKDAISSDRAFEVARPVLEYFHLSQEKGLYDIYLWDTRSREPDDLRFADWVIEREFEYKGLPCPGAIVRMTVAAATGEIMSVIFIPTLPAEATPAPEISASEAYEIAKRTPPEHGAVLAPLDSIRKVIAPANGAFGTQKMDDKLPVKNCICWEIPFAVSHNGRSIAFVAWIDTKSGTIVGGKPKHLAK